MSGSDPKFFWDRIGMAWHVSLEPLCRGVESLTAITESLSIGERLDRVAPGRYLLKWTLFVRFALFWDFFDLSMAGVLLGLWLHSGDSSAGLHAAFISVTARGILVGHIAAAAFVTRVGRKTTPLWALSFDLNRVGLGKSGSG